MVTFRKKSRFFVSSDFNAFDTSIAESVEDNVIAARQYVVDNRFKVLHFDNHSGNGLKDFFQLHRLYPHWQLQHLTNVYWPYPIANGGWVDYLRLGYGKEKALVQDLAKRSGVFKEITNLGERDAVAFYCVTQLQIGLNSEVWWINLYIDKKGWLEQYNLLDKLLNRKFEEEFLKLLDNIANEEYAFYIYPYSDGDILEFYDGDKFINEMRNFRTNGQSCSISIEKTHEPNDINNNKDMLAYLKGEFSKLLPLYNFISWHPKSNNFLKGL